MITVCRIAIISVACIIFESPALAQQDVFHGCAMEGTTKIKSVQALNQLKNRHSAPSSQDIDQSITFKAMLKTGNDRNRWQNTQAAEITGYVAEIVPGGKESVNCCNSKMTASQCPYHDTHIALVIDPKQQEKTRHVIVEVTPRWREIKEKDGDDWSHKTLQKTLLHKWIKVRGWVMLDVEHVNASENTTPGNTNNWRATAWEVHPVTSIEILPGPPK